MDHGIYEVFVLYEDSNGKKGNYEMILLAKSPADAMRMSSHIMSKKFSTLNVLDSCAVMVEDDWLPVRKFGQTAAGFRRAKNFCDARKPAVTP
jgi:hypothetical protein